MNTIQYYIGKTIYNIMYVGIYIWLVCNPKKVKEMNDKLEEAMKEIS